MSATQLMTFLNNSVSEDNEDLVETFPEYFSDKMTSYYQFMKTKEKFFNRQCKEVIYTRTSRKDEKVTVSEITKLFMQMKDDYLLHRKYVDNDQNVWPQYRSNYHGKFFHFDFSENISLVEKHQAQEAAYSGKQYTLHCTWMDPPKSAKIHISLKQ